MTEAEVGFRVFEILVGGYSDPLDFEDFLIISKQAHAITGVVLYGNEPAAVAILDSMKAPKE